MMARTIQAATLLAWCCAFLFVTAARAGDDATITTSPTAVAVPHMTIEEFSAQSRRILHRTPRRVRIYRDSLGPNAVRVCNAHYEQEFRPSGTVIVPRMTCYWRG
jgi:hypothetical protein